MKHLRASARTFLTSDKHLRVCLQRIRNKNKYISFHKVTTYNNNHILNVDKGYRHKTSLIFLLVGTGIFLVLFYIYRIVPPHQHLYIAFYY